MHVARNSPTTVASADLRRGHHCITEFQDHTPSNGLDKEAEIRQETSRVVATIATAIGRCLEQPSTIGKENSKHSQLNEELNWLVVTGTCFIFPYIGNIPIDFHKHIFQRGWNSTPKQLKVWKHLHQDSTTFQISSEKMCLWGSLKARGAGKLLRRSRSPLEKGDYLLEAQGWVNRGEGLLNYSMFWFMLYYIIVCFSYIWL